MTSKSQIPVVGALLLIVAALTCSFLHLWVMAVILMIAAMICAIGATS